MRGSPAQNDPSPCSARRGPLLVALPVFAVRRIGEEVVEVLPAWRSLERVLPNAMLSASRPVGSFMNRSDFDTAQVSGFTSWPNR